MRNLRHLECQRPCGCMLPIIALLALTWSPVNCLLFPSVSSVRGVWRIAPTQPHNAALRPPFWHGARHFVVRMKEDPASADAKPDAMAQKEAAKIQADADDAIEAAKIQAAATDRQTAAQTAATDRQTAGMLACGIFGLLVMNTQIFVFATAAMLFGLVLGAFSYWRDSNGWNEEGWSGGIYVNETINTRADTDTTIEFQYKVQEEQGPEVLPGALCSASPVPASAETLWEPDSVGDSTADSIGDSVGDPPEIPSKADVSERKEEVSETRSPSEVEYWRRGDVVPVGPGSSKTDLSTNAAPPALADCWVEISIDNGAGGMSYWHHLRTGETVLRRPQQQRISMTRPPPSITTEA